MTRRNSIWPSTAARRNSGYAIGARHPHLSRRRCERGRHSKPAVVLARRRRGSPSRLGMPFHEIAIHAFPDGEIRVTAGPAAPTTIIYASLDRPNDKLIALTVCGRSAAARRREAPRAAWRPISATCGRIPPSTRAKRSARRSSARCSRGCVDRVVTVDAHLHRTPDIEAVFPGIESDNLSAMPAISDALRKTGLDPATVVVGPDAESLPWVSDLAGRLGLSYTVAQKTRRGDRSVAIGISGPGMHRRPTRPDRRRYRLVRRHHDRLRQGADRRRRDGDRRRRHTRAVSGSSLHASMISSGIRSIRSTHSVPHSTNAIALDDLFVDALKGERCAPETSR